MAIKMQYGAVRSQDRRQSSRHVYIYGSGYGVNRRVRRKSSGFLTLLIKRKMEGIAEFLALSAVRNQLTRVIFITVLFVVLCNFICAVMADGVRSEITALQSKQIDLETVNIHLLAKRAVAWGPTHLAKMAEEKLELYPAEKGQYQVYNRTYQTFR